MPVTRRSEVAPPPQRSLSVPLWRDCPGGAAHRRVTEVNDCVFCGIVAGTAPATKVYEDETLFAFRDINPQAPTHILVIPKAHIPSVDGITAENSAVVAHIFEVIPQIAAAEGLVNGFRVVSNCGDDGCQSVHHLHFHILGGKKLSEQMA